MYGGGQFELGPGRGQIQYLASVFHPDGPNDVAPTGFKKFASVDVGFYPYGLAVTRDGRKAYVAQSDAAAVVERTRE